MLALGCSNFLGSFFKIHVICCALSVTLAVDSAGGKSQVGDISCNCDIRLACKSSRDEYRGLLLKCLAADRCTHALLQFASLCVMLVVMVTMLALGAYLKPLPKVGGRNSVMLSP